MLSPLLGRGKPCRFSARDGRTDRGGRQQRGGTRTESRQCTCV
uniref:Uncharacterized protein n=1 Tax=Arundo donax TaxID=35708 RepID=A0A0A9EPV1_ARUDO